MGKKMMKDMVKGAVKWFLPFCLFALLPLNVSAQGFRFGYLSYTEAFRSMPDFEKAQNSLQDLRGKFDTETKRVEEEFNKKYEQFLDGQRDFAPSILKKRQAELQELMTKNIAFKEESERLLKQAEADAYAPLKARLATVLEKIGKEKGYAFILNTDNNATPYINTEMGEDVTPMVTDALK